MKAFYKFVILLDKYKFPIVGIMFTFIFVWGFSIYYAIYELSFMEALSYTINLFVDDVQTVKDFPDANNSSIQLLGNRIELSDSIFFNKESWKWIHTVAFFAKVTLFLTVIIFFIKSQLASVFHYFAVKKGNHVLVIGLDSNSRFFINSELKKGNDNIVVVENDEYNPYIEIYRNKAIPVIHKELESVIDEIGIDSAKYIFVSTGDSEENISHALMIIDKAKDNPNKRLLVHIEDRTLRSLYNDTSLLGSHKLDVRPFSYHKESARMLFQTHDIDGDGLEIIESNKAYAIAVVGNSNLAVEVIVEAIKMSHLPNENMLTIYCIGNNVKAFKKRVKYEIPYIKSVKHVELNFMELEHNDIKFYEHKIWNEESLKHAIFCYSKPVTNINVSTKLKRVAYAGELNHSIRKLHIATYSSIDISKELRKYNRENKDIFIFAAANLVCHRDNLIGTDIAKLAKRIQYSYQLKSYNPSVIIQDEEKIKKVWDENVTINNKRSSMAQAKHMKVKLKALGLKKIKSDKSIEKLAEINEKIFNLVLKEELEELHLKEKELDMFSQELKKFYSGKAYNLHYFPKDFNTIFEKLLRAEHNRWIAMLVMMDNRYDKSAKKMDEKKRRIKKVHHLMKPFDKFEEDEKILILYDIYALCYIPVYMASLGYELVERKQ